jgi:hypothetical protein
MKFKFVNIIQTMREFSIIYECISQGARVVEQSSL